MRTPWIVSALLRIPIRIARALARWAGRLGRILYFGPSYYCWCMDCWEPAWSGCQATRENGNGRMCEEHCRSKPYHGERDTGCDHPSWLDETAPHAFRPTLVPLE